MAKQKHDDEIIFEAKNLQISAIRDDGSELPIVKGVDFNVKRGEVIALIGESGSGKTTISLASLGYCKPGLKFAGGEALFKGQDVSKMTTDELRPIRGEKVAYLAQSAAATFNPSIRINEQVTEAPILHKTKTKEQADKKALELYHALELPDPENIGNRFPHQVSGGQLQRLMAAMALCGDPDLLVLDEPTTALDVTTQIEVLKAFKSVIKQQGAAAIYVTHDLAVVAQIADHIVVLYNGEVKEAGPTDVLINSPQHPYTKRLMEAIRPMPEAGLGEDVGDEHLRDVPVLEVNKIDAGYGKIVNGMPSSLILKDVNVSIKRGKTVGIIGESGCGKSTLARVFAGLLPPANGSIALDGEALAPSLKQRSHAELRKIQFVYQMADTALNPRQRIGDILGRPLEFYHGLSGKKKTARVNELLEMVELPSQFAQRYPHELSGGQKQRINLARALASDPEVVLCDEVTSALDTIVGANVIELLKRLRRDLGVSFVFISHDLSTVASFADEIVVLYAGRVAEQGPTDQVLSPPYHPYTRLLISSVPEPRVGWLEDMTKTKEAVSGISGAVDIDAIGCPFFKRCPHAISGTCDTTAPPRQIDNNNHIIECHLDIKDLL
ncbi:MAG TPA: ABC transporter [Alphaproteobacteria bacterium]|nr:ABC transporter [Alphaproteobacteria bacterium]